MIKIDMWYKDNYIEADKIDITFYDNACEYRGNIYKNGEMIGDYTCDNFIELEETFNQLYFNWD